MGIPDYKVHRAYADARMSEVDLPWLDEDSRCSRRPRRRGLGGVDPEQFAVMADAHEGGIATDLDALAQVARGHRVERASAVPTGRSGRRFPLSAALPFDLKSIAVALA